MREREDTPTQADAAPVVSKTSGVRVEWPLMIVLALVWGGSFFFNKVALSEVSPLLVVLSRVGFAALALNAFMLVQGHRLPTSGHIWVSFLSMALLNNVFPFTLIMYGQTQIASGLAAILNATTPLFAVVFARAFAVDERVSPRHVAGVLTGLGGVTVMMGMEALAGVGANLLAQAAVLGAACSYALAGMFGRRFSQLPPLTVATGQLTASTLMLSLVVLPLEQPWALPAPSIPVIGALAGLSLLSTAIAYLLYFRILAASGATNLLLVTLLIPVSAVLLGTALLGERLASHHLFGMLLIALSLASIDGRLMQWVQSLFRSTRGQLVERNTSRL